MCSHFKKGVHVLLSMGKRVLARIVLKRLRWFAEHLELMDENQCGFRGVRSTVYVAQIVMRMNDYVCGYRKSREIGRVNVAEEDERPFASLQI